ncbi:hypothetical protein MKX01_030662, partial [Papaver californicum]
MFKPYIKHQWRHKSIVTPPNMHQLADYKTFNQLTNMVESEFLKTSPMISRSWNEVDFMRTNEVTRLDLLMLDENGDQLHGVIPKKIIWKFEPPLLDDVIYSLSKLNIAPKKKICWTKRNDSPLDSTMIKMPRNKFSFTTFKDLESNITNIYLTDVVGVLIILTSIQEIKRVNGQLSIMCDLTLQNLSGVNVKITLWGDSTRELSRNFDQHGIEHTPVVIVVTYFVWNITSSSFNL